MACYPPSASRATNSRHSQSNKCPTCEKTVYAAEEVRADGKFWHKGGCFKCQECKTQLEKGKELSKPGDGRTVCKNCYAKLFGPKGFGFGGAMGNH